jgi:DNA polymerase-4/protein ImuB
VTATLTSSRAACVWVPQFALRCEEAERPDLAGQPVAILAPDGGRRLLEVSHAARRAGVRAGMTVGQGIGLCPGLRLCEADPLRYDRRFAELAAALGEVTPVVEAAELGRIFAGLDGLDGIHGDPASQAAAIRRAADGALPAPLRPGVRVGTGLGRFTAWVAAIRARPGVPRIVPDPERLSFLAAQPIAALGADPATTLRLSQLGLATLGAFAALPEEAVASQFGREGRRLWRLATGKSVDPVVGRPPIEPVEAVLDLSAPTDDRELLLRLLGRLVTRALRHPRRRGWRVQGLEVRATLERGPSWRTALTLREPAALPESIVAPVAARLAALPPPAPVIRLTVIFTALVPGTVALQLFARDASAAARAGRSRALRAAAEELRLRFGHPLLARVVEVQTWSRLPERRYALIDFDP